MFFIAISRHRNSDHTSGFMRGAVNMPDGSTNALMTPDIRLAHAFPTFDTADNCAKLLNVYSYAILQP